MNKVKAFIERGNDGSYGVYVDLEDNTLNYGIHGEGSTVNEAISDFKDGYLEMKKVYEEEGMNFVETDFEFYYDTASFLNYISKKITLAGLQRITGVNQGQLSNYVNGHRHPSKRTIRKIESSLQSFGKEISRIQFI